MLDLSSVILSWFFLVVVVLVAVGFVFVLRHCSILYAFCILKEWISIYFCRTTGYRKLQGWSSEVVALKTVPLTGLRDSIGH